MFVQVGKYQPVRKIPSNGSYVIGVDGHKFWVDLEFQEEPENDNKITLFTIKSNDADYDVELLEGCFALETGKIAMKMVLATKEAYELRGKLIDGQFEGRVNIQDNESRFNMRWLEDESRPGMNEKSESVSIYVAENEDEPRN